MSKIPEAHDLIMGVDPGLSGAIAFYHIKEDRPFLVADMPLTIAPDKKNEIDVEALADLLIEYAPRIKLAVVEDVHSMPGQGVVSMFRFGESKGIIIGLIAAHLIPIYKVKPAVWKSLTGLSRDKSASRALIVRMFPENRDDFRRVKDDGRAEALLLAVFGKRFLGNSN
jgi:crossover junction endodeoxyribonuclease RuvC